MGFDPAKKHFTGTTVLGPIEIGKYAILRDEKASGTDGGTFTSGDWRTRDLNTKLVDEIGITLSSNQFTLSAGTYRLRASAPAKGGVIRHTTRLYNITDDEVALSGTAELLVNTGNHSTSHAWLVGNLELTKDTTFEVQHQCQQTVSTNGFGLAIGSSFAVAVEVYTIVEILKVD